MSKDTLTALGAGALSAFASMAFLSGIPGALLVVYIAPLPLLLAGLAMGPQAASLAALGGIVVAGLAGGPMAGVLFTVIHGLPVWMIVRLALLRRTAEDGDLSDWYPSGSILALISVYAAGGFMVVMISALSEDGGLRVMITDYLGMLLGLIMPSMEEATMDQLIESVVPLFPGYMGVSWVVMVAVNASAALALLTRRGRLLRPDNRLDQLALPDWLSWLLIGAAALALIGTGEMQFAGRNLALILAVPFFFLGLSVVHAVAGKTTFRGPFLVGFYLFLLLTGWIIFAVIAVGLAEQWTGLRRRLDKNV